MGNTSFCKMNEREMFEMMAKTIEQHQHMRCLPSTPSLSNQGTWRFAVFGCFRPCLDTSVRVWCEYAPNSVQRFSRLAFPRASRTHLKFFLTSFPILVVCMRDTNTRMKIFDVRAHYLE